MSLTCAYEYPQEPGALGGVEPFAKAQKLKPRNIVPSKKAIYHFIYKPDVQKVQV